MKNLTNLFQVVIAFVLATTGLFAIPPQPALAAEQIIDGDPVDVHVLDTGIMEPYYDNWANKYQYYNQESCGSVLFLNGTAQGFDSGDAGTFGCGSLTDFTAVSNSKPDDWTIETVYAAGGTGVQIKQTTEYVNGNAYYQMTWEISNTGGNTYTDLRFIHGGDTYFGGLDNSNGHYDSGLDMVYLTNAGVTGIMGLLGTPSSPIDHYFEDHYITNNNEMCDGRLPDTVNASYVDAGYSVEWDRATLAPGNVWTIVAIEKWTAAGDVQVFAPAGQTIYVGDTVTYQFVVQNLQSSADTFNLSLNSSAGWTVSLPGGNTVAIGAGSSAPVAVQVTADTETTDVTRLTATSQTDPLVTNYDSVTTVGEVPPNNPPTCSPVSISTDEDNPGSTSANCNDPDGDTLTYEVTQPNWGIAPNPSGTTLTFNPNGQYESLPFGGSDTTNGDFTYRAYDGQAYSGWTNVQVTVNGVNDAPTDIGLDNNSVVENDPSGTPVGNLSTTDIDNGDTHTYSLAAGCGGTDNGSFNISVTSLRTNAVFDYEVKNTYAICVRTTDSGGLYYNEQFNIGIINEPCDLEITKVVSDPTPAEFWSIVYTVTVTNHGPDHAKDIVISDTQPSSVTFSATSTTQGPYDISTGVWDVGTLNNGLSATLIITADVDPGWELEYITNTAIITEFDQLDSYPSDNRADRLIVVHGSEFEVIKTVDDCTPHEGIPFTYTIALHNTGYTSTAVISDILPISMTYVSSHTTQGNYNPINGVWDAGMLDINETQWLYITAYPIMGTAHTTISSTATITNTAILTDSSRLDPESSNDIGDVFVNVQKANAVEANITPGAGGLLIYTDTQGLTTTVMAPANAVTDTITLIYTPITVPHRAIGNPLPDPLEPITPGLLLAGHAFDLTVYDCPDCTFLPRYAFTRPVTITIHYSDEDVAGLQEDELFVACWDGAAWYDAAATCDPGSVYGRHPDENGLSVPICHLTQCGLFGPPVPVGGVTEPTRPPALLQPWLLLAALVATGAIVAVLALKRRTN